MGLRLVDFRVLHQKMAGRSKNTSDRFLSPAYFQVTRPKIPSQQTTSAPRKLLPPSEYNVVKDQGEESEKVLVEIDILQNENRQLREQLKRSKEEEIRLKGEIRKSRLLVQKGRVDDALDLKQMAELHEENLSLQSEVKKLRATNSKLKIDVKEVKSNFETDLGRCEAELEKAHTLIKELKAEMRQKEEIFEREVESLEKRARKQMTVVKSLKAQVKNAEEQVKIDRNGFEEVISKNEFDKYEQVKAIKKTLDSCEVKYAKELHALKDEISSRDEIYSATKRKLTTTEEEANDLKEKLKEKEMECSTVIKQHQEKMRDSQLYYDKTLTDLSRKLEEQTLSHQRELQNLTGK